MRLIVTRPEPDGSRTAQALVALGHEPILSPAFDIVFPAGVELPARLFQAILATSANAVRALAQHPQRSRLAGTPLLAVGDAAALSAKRAGFEARSAGGDMTDLMRLACAELDPESGSLLYIAGADRSGDLAGDLGRQGFMVETLVLYRAEPRNRLSPAAATALRDDAVDGVLLYSRRSAAAFALALRAERLAPLSPRVTCFCIAPAAVGPLGAVVSGPVLAADRPDQISLFALLERATPEIGGAPV